MIRKCDKHNCLTNKRETKLKNLNDFNYTVSILYVNLFKKKTLSLYKSIYLATTI